MRVQFCDCYVCSVLCIRCTVVCKCELYRCHRVSTKLQLNIYHIISYQVYTHLRTSAPSKSACAICWENIILHFQDSNHDSPDAQAVVCTKHPSRLQSKSKKSRNYAVPHYTVSSPYYFLPLGPKCVPQAAVFNTNVTCIIYSGIV